MKISKINYFFWQACVEAAKVLCPHIQGQNSKDCCICASFEKS